MSGVCDVLILAVLAVLVVLAVRRIRKHGSGCGGDCSNCGASCAKRQEKNGKEE